MEPVNPLQTVGDILVYPPRDLRKKLHESKSQVGGALTVLLPIALAVAFGVMYGEPPATRQQHLHHQCQ